MREIRVLGAFTLRFAIVFTLLVLPWPALNHFLHAVFLAETRCLVHLAFHGKFVRVESYQDPLHSSIDTKVTVGDPHNARSDGQAQVKVITLDGRSLAWIPHAVWFGLCAATPMNRARKVRMVLAGLPGVQLFVAVTVFNAVLAGLIDETSPRWQASVVEMLNHLLLDNLWVSFVVPLIFWCIWLGWQGDWNSVLGGPQQQR